MSVGRRARARCIRTVKGERRSVAVARDGSGGGGGGGGGGGKR